MIRVPLAMALTIIMLIAIGFLGYFIPFNSFTLDVVESNQKKNLTEQNNALLRKIISTLKLLNNLKDQVARLESKRKVAAQFSGVGEENAEVKNHIDFRKMNSDELLRYVENRENLLQSVYDKVNNESFFKSVPVIYPVKDSFVVSRGYGPAVDPFTSKKKWHYGVDIVAKESTPIIAAASGTATKVENSPVWGIRVEIDHGNGFQTIYAHIGQATVSKGNKVHKGQTIGKMGLSGLSTGMHLHYEVLRNGIHINPRKILFPLPKK